MFKFFVTDFILVAPLPNDDGPKNAPLWLLQDPLVLVKDWFSLDENQLIRCIKEYVRYL